MSNASVTVTIFDSPGYVSYECKSPVGFRIFLTLIEIVSLLLFFYLVIQTTVISTSDRSIPGFVIFIMGLSLIVTLGLCLVSEAFRHPETLMIDIHTGEAQVFRDGLLRKFFTKKTNMKNVSEARSVFVSQIKSGFGPDRVMIQLKLKTGQWMNLPEVTDKKEGKWILLLIHKHFPEVGVSVE